MFTDIFATPKASLNTGGENISECFIRAVFSHYHSMLFRHGLTSVDVIWRNGDGSAEFCNIFSGVLHDFLNFIDIKSTKREFLQDFLCDFQQKGKKEA